MSSISRFFSAVKTHVDATIPTSARSKENVSGQSTMHGADAPRATARDRLSSLAKRTFAPAVAPRHTRAGSIAHMFSAVPVTTQSSVDQQLKSWIKSAPPGEKAQRLAAAKRISLATNDKTQNTLDLSNLQLTSLPDCLAQLSHIKNLKLSGNMLTVLTSLPPELEALNAWGNQLTSAPTLPNSVAFLELGNNKLAVTPSCFPHNPGDDFAIFRSELSHWADTAPASEKAARWHAAQQIENAYVNDSRSVTLQGLGLTALPECMSKLAKLRQLDLGHNQLTDLGHMPPNIRELFAENNNVRVLPDVLPKNLKTLNLSNNYLSGLSTLPGRVTTLRVDHNLLTSAIQVPPTVTNLAIAGNPFIPKDFDLTARARELHYKAEYQPRVISNRLNFHSVDDFYETDMPASRSFEQLGRNELNAYREFQAGPTAHVTRAAQKSLQAGQAAASQGIAREGVAPSSKLSVGDTVRIGQDFAAVIAVYETDVDIEFPNGSRSSHAHGVLSRE